MHRTAFPALNSSLVTSNPHPPPAPMTATLISKLKYKSPKNELFPEGQLQKFEEKFDFVKTARPRG